VHPVIPDGSPPELKDSFDSLFAPLLLNSALAALKIQPQTPSNAHTGIDCATRALDRMTLNKADRGECHLRVFCDSPNNAFAALAKAFYRRALAHVILKEEDAAESDLIAANELVPEDQAITNELAKVKQRRKEKKEKEKKAFKKMFA
jgi:peptidyl-prolyl isomerase D